MKLNAPNVLTLIRILVIPVFVAVYFWNGPNWNIYAAIIFVGAAITDWLDGFLARRNNQVSNFGKLWDPIADKLLVLAAMLLLVDWGKIGIVVLLIIEGRELIMGGVRALSASKGVVIAADFTGKLKTVVQFAAIILFLLGDWPFGIFQELLGTILIWIAAIFSVYSCIEYFYKNRQLLKDE